MNNDYDITLLEKYIDRELTESELHEFQARLLTDMSFKAMVDKEKILIGQIRREGLQKDLHYLKSLEKTLSKPRSGSLTIGGFSWHYAIAAAIVGVLVIVGLMVYSPKPTPEELFVAYFKPITNIVEPIDRGSNPSAPTTRSEAFQAYEANDYQKAALLFTELNKQKQEAGILLLLGNSNLMIGNISEAERNFTTLSRDFDEYDLQAQWYLSLCYLKMEDVERARAILNELGNTEVIYADKAKELLKEVD
jgi:hypothetical protein